MTEIDKWRERREGMNRVSVIIPAYRPDQKLMGTLEGLCQAGFTDLLVVDDGSGPEFAPLFQQVQAVPGCTLLRHPVNRGKGAALKTAMDYFLQHRPEQAGVVTADADGQHLPQDIAAVARAMLDSGQVVLGVRDFSDPIVPWKSRAGNRITIAVFRLFLGMKISDTQTGLRAIPRQHLPLLAGAKGERYEYETNMLFLMNRCRIPFGEVRIAAVYLEGNRSSHFRVVQDSLRIYALILKYLCSSLGACVVDELAFFLLKLLGAFSFLPIPTTFTAAFLARAVSSLFNFLVNARLVFEEQVSPRSLIRYYILAVCQITVSACLVFLVEHVLSISSPALVTLAKVVVDTLLFFISFRVQHRWVFRRSGDSQEGKDKAV